MGMAGGIVAGAVLGGVSTAVQANQQKIAAQKQRDAVADAEKRQNELLDQQKAQDAERKKKEEAAVQASFVRAGAARRPTSGASIPGAVAASAIGTQGNPAAAAKKLIGS